MATHEKCDGCISDDPNAPKEKTYPFLYANWVESNPMEQMERQHRLQIEGKRQIVLGPGEAEVNTRQTPADVSKQLHYVAEQCGYMVGNLTPDKGDGKQSLIVWKEYGPFVIEWESGRLRRILQGEDKSVFWDSAKAW